MGETVFSEDGCVFCPAGVCCPDGPSSECSHCGWNPRIAAARADRIRRKLRCGVEIEAPAEPIARRYEQARKLRAALCQRQRRAREEAED